MYYVARFWWLWSCGLWVGGGCGLWEVVGCCGCGRLWEKKRTRYATSRIPSTLPPQHRTTHTHPHPHPTPKPEIEQETNERSCR